MKFYKILLIKKPSPKHVEIIVGWPLSFGDILHETAPSIVLFDGHSSTIVFNAIKISFNSMSLGHFFT